MITTSFPFDYLKNCIFPITGIAVCMNKFSPTNLGGIEKSLEKCLTSPIQVIVKYESHEIAEITIQTYDKPTNLLTYSNLIPLDGTQPLPYTRHVTNNMILDETTKTISPSNWIKFGAYPIYSASTLYQVAVTMTFTSTITITYNPELPNCSTIVVVPYLTQYVASGDGSDTFSETRTMTNLHVSDSYDEDPQIPNWNTIEMSAQVRSYGYTGPCSAELRITITELKYTCNGEPVTTGNSTIFWYNNPSQVYTLHMKE